MNADKRSCENCGNHACRNNVVAIWYDACVRDGFTVHWQPQTNADRIRAMSDEELAEKMCGHAIDTICDIVCDRDCCAGTEDGCIAKLLDWLKQPAEVK